MQVVPSSLQMYSEIKTDEINSLLQLIT